MSYALCAIGNALVDIIVSTDDDFLRANNVVKGSMTLVDDAEPLRFMSARGRL